MKSENMRKTHFVNHAFWEYWMIAEMDGLL